MDDVRDLARQFYVDAHVSSESSRHHVSISTNGVCFRVGMVLVGEVLGKSKGMCLDSGCFVEPVFLPLSKISGSRSAVCQLLCCEVDIPPVSCLRIRFA